MLLVSLLSLLLLLRLLILLLNYYCCYRYYYYHCRGGDPNIPAMGGTPAREAPRHKGGGISIPAFLPYAVRTLAFPGRCYFTITITITTTITPTTIIIITTTIIIVVGRHAAIDRRPLVVARLCGYVGHCCCHAAEWVIAFGRFLARFWYLGAS